MTTSTLPFALPQTLAAELDRVKGHWHGLLRGSAEIPFADDLSLEDLPGLKPQLALVEVFERPERFRFCYIGEEMAEVQAKSLNGKFLDEIDLPFPFEFIRSQASATVEGGKPTFYETAADSDHDHPAYQRLMLPLWGDGHVSLLLVAFEGLEP